MEGRCLFGRTMEENKWLQNKLDETLEEASQRWGFDFKTGQPMDNPRYVWTKMPASEVPETYRPTSSTSKKN